jgi:hypothetical protein
MARYEDYVKDELDGEIEEAAAEQRARDEKGRFIPDRFKDKDITDVIKSYEELEKMNSRQAQDLGEMRRTVDKLLELQSQSASQPAPEDSAPAVTVDDIYEDTEGAITRVAKKVASGEIGELKQELAELRTERRLESIGRKYPGWETKVAESEFADWAKESQYRTRLAQQAYNGDLDAAEELLGYYYHDLEGMEEQKAEEREQEHPQARNLRNAISESGGPSPSEVEETYSRSELMETRIAAQQGSLKAQRWLAAHADEIQSAYIEGRIVD